MTDIFNLFNPAQWFMIVQMITCAAGAFGFVFSGQPVAGSIWALYGLANIGWFLIASGYK